MILKQEKGKGKTTVRITIKNVLQRVKAEELSKPVSERRYVPTLTALAKASGVSRQAYTMLVNNQTKHISKDVLGASLQTLQDLGYDVSFDDLLELE